MDFTKILNNNLKNISENENNDNSYNYYKEKIINDFGIPFITVLLNYFNRVL